MTEKEKMLNTLPYVGWDPELEEEKARVRELVYDFNNSRPYEREKRDKLITKIFGSRKKNAYMEPPFHCDYGYNIHVGENFYANFNLTILDCNRVEIGDNVLIAPNVTISAAGHPIHPEMRTVAEYSAPVKIGSDVWLGAGVIVNPGVTIGEGSVIGSGSVVTKDLPPMVVAAGNPCRVLREITEEDKQYYFKKMKF